MLNIDDSRLIDVFVRRHGEIKFKNDIVQIYEYKDNKYILQVYDTVDNKCIAVYIKNWLKQYTERYFCVFDRYFNVKSLICKRGWSSKSLLKHIKEEGIKC